MKEYSAIFSLIGAVVVVIGLIMFVGSCSASYPEEKSSNINISLFVLGGGITLMIIGANLDEDD